MREIVVRYTDGTMESLQVRTYSLSTVALTVVLADDASITIPAGRIAFIRENPAKPKE